MNQRSSFRVEDLKYLFCVYAFFSPKRRIVVLITPRSRGFHA